MLIGSYKSVCQSIHHSQLLIMKTLKKNLAKKLHYKRLTKSTTAIAGLTGAASAITGATAALVAPTGLSALSVAIGISSAPFIVTAAPFIAGAAATVGTAAGILKFYAWYKDDVDDEGDDDKSQTAHET
jgi:cystathionine beta-lyase/cystathionine gamma-synthase